MRFEDWCPPDRLRALYAQADVFAIASFAKGIPVVPMEAMAIEIACVATWIARVPELIRNELDGVLEPPGEEVELARALGRLIDDSDFRLRVAESARQRVLEHYDLNRNVEALAALFNELANAKIV